MSAAVDDRPAAPPARRRRRSRTALAAAVLVPTLGVAGLVGGGWLGSSRALSPGTATYDWSLADYPELRPESVTIASRTGVRLSGRFVLGRTRAAVVVSHGYGGTQDELLPVVAALHRAGFSVLSYDLRGCGGSTGQISFGTHEQQDLRSVVDYLAGRPEVDPQRIGAFGFSMGAATTLLTSADDPRIRAVVADSAWSDVSHWLRPSWRQGLTRPAAQFSPLSLFFVARRTGADFADLRPVERVARISPRPLLLISGPEDTVVPATDSDENLAAAGEPKQLWQIPGAGHGDTTAEPAYERRVTDFFTGALLDGVPARPR